MSNLRRKLPSANALFVFEAAARCGSFTRAAAQLGVTQPAVSRMLSLLEAHLEVQLFVRTSGGISLTDNGNILYRGIEDGFRHIEEAIQEIRARHTGMETITLSVSTAFTTHWLMPRMHRLQQEFPTVDLRFQLISGSVKGSVEDVDLGLRFMTSNDEEHESALIMPEILIPVCSSEYRAQHFPEASTPGELTLISLSDSRANWSDLFPEFVRLCPAPPHELNFSDYAVVLQAAMLGQGVAIGWFNVTTHWFIKGALVPAISCAIMTERQCHFIHSRKKPPSDATLRVRDWLIEEIRTETRQVMQRYPELALERYLVGCL
ncbi:MAG: LysR family transcriptional regulator [Salinicola sp.]|uniref:LysR family transcriptional regulator n=1 Tax=Salinicola sp. TaxID=1978524 RepID=UPI001E11A05E|nr:LysR family transcriptional regulator [Salinicola sp.]NRB55079.1 LysR family transcriptional regulator [Salinicola sp.]